MLLSAQTELAHGSNVAGLETTATFDEQTDEFVIHTPSVSATKWWIGGASALFVPQSAQATVPLTYAMSNSQAPPTPPRTAPSSPS